MRYDGRKELLQHTHTHTHTHTHNLQLLSRHLRQIEVEINSFCNRQC
ncbi:MAG: hypothetical protein LBC92_01980 [Rickettsiales bacterium]|nr:hypothetical protein [Rickettsiales bacterium]